jgi:hypothetical protein
MSQRQYIKMLQSQLQLLNQRIDRRIMTGQSYRALARQHRVLVAKIRSYRNPGFFDRVASMLHREYA